MGGDAEAAQPLHVLDHVARLAAERVRRLREAERDVVPLRGADLDGVEAQDAGSIRGRIRRARAVAMVGEDDEIQPGPRGGRGHVLRRTRSVGVDGVDVNDADRGARG